jgi:hypothetical protein
LPWRENGPTFTVALASMERRSTLSSSAAASCTLLNWSKMASIFAIFFWLILLDGLELVAQIVDALAEHLIIWQLLICVFVLSNQLCSYFAYAQFDLHFALLGFGSLF